MNEQMEASAKRYGVQKPATCYRETLEIILKVCAESSDYSRRTQFINSEVMKILGFTEGQRVARHDRILQRSEQYKENRSMLGKSRARQELREQQMEDACDD